ncbi:cytochrome P450 52A12 [Penicillium tannophilum]|nr:cytochrome P450 52A12 [Penicillium tannophilum]
MYLSLLAALILGISTGTWQVSRSIAAIRHRRRLAQQHGCQAPPSLPQKDRILGTDVSFEEYCNFRSNSYLEMLKERFESCGHTWASTSMGRTSVSTIDIENIKTILVTDSKLYGLGRTRSSVLGTTLDHGIFTSEGNEWKFLRRMSKPGFSASHVNLEPHIQSLVSQIPSDGSPVDLQPLFHDLTLYNATSIFWGQDAVNMLDAQDQSLSRRINAAICKAFEHTQEVMVFGPMAKLFQSSSTEKAIKLVYGFIFDNSNAAFTLKNYPATQQFVHDKTVSSLFYDQFGAHGFDTAHIQIRQMFMAAEGTTAETLTHLFLLLSRHPRVLDDLRAEITSQLPNGTIPTASHLNSKLEYMNACVKEVLRLYPTVPFNNRVALQDTVLPRGGGPDGLSPIVVPAGSEISLPHYPLYRRKDIFGDDAEEFVPERWLSSDDEKSSDSWTKQSENYLPFSIGKRACPGRQIALETVRYATVRLIQHFPYICDASGGRPWQENCGATLQSKHGAVVSMRGKMEFDISIDSGYGSDNVS